MFCVKNCIKGSATNYIVNNTKGIFLLDCVALLVYVIVRKHNFFRKEYVDKINSSYFTAYFTTQSNYYVSPHCCIRSTFCCFSNHRHQDHIDSWDAEI